MANTAKSVARAHTVTFSTDSDEDWNLLVEAGKRIRAEDRERGVITPGFLGWTGSDEDMVRRAIQRALKDTYRPED